MKTLTSKCCGTAVRNVGETSKFAVCLSCNQPCGIVVNIDSGGGSIGDNRNNNFNIH
jgi:hypothetical protein